MWYDVFVLAILIVGMVRGAVRGVVWQLAGIAGIVLCLVFAETISAIGSPLVSLEPPLDQWVVMFVAYLFFSFLSFGFARLINGALEKAELKEYNKHLGAIFGVVKGVVLCLVITFFLVTLSETTRDILKHSRSARYAAIIMDRLHPVMPQKLRGALTKYLQNLDAPELDLKYADGTTVPAGTGEEPWDPFEPHAPVGPNLGQNPSGSPLGNPPPTQSTQPGMPTTAQAIDALLQRIPGLAQDGWTRDWARQIYEATPESRRQQLVQDLQTAAPTMLFSVLERWQRPPAASQQTNPAPQPATPSPWDFNSGSTQNVNYTQPPAASRKSLVRDIATRLARSPQEQTGFEQQINLGLQGLPDGVSLGVLQDWHADVTSAAVDPDPQTDGYTNLTDRIVRQLVVQRVHISELSQDAQTRLMKARRQ